MLLMVLMTMLGVSRAHNDDGDDDVYVGDGGVGVGFVAGDGSNDAGFDDTFTDDTADGVFG